MIKQAQAPLPNLCFHQSLDMNTHKALKNERIKHTYARHLAEAHGYDVSTVDRVMSALARFEAYTQFKDFKKFHREQAIGFKSKLAKAANQKTGEALSKSTVHSVLNSLKTFFIWLSREPGYRSCIKAGDALYFNLSRKQKAIARARKVKHPPTLAEIEQVLAAMPSASVLERRNRAVIAMATLTGARVNALASFCLKHFNLEECYVDQDARDVRTKFAKTFRTYLMPVSETAMTILKSWVKELREDCGWQDDQPIFPATKTVLDEHGLFTAGTLAPYGWSDSGPIRKIFKDAFEEAGLAYRNPHTMRDMLVHYAMSLDLTPEAMKAWSQNLGHTNVMTTLTSYGQVPVHRQGELIRAVKQKQIVDVADVPTAVLLEEFNKRMLTTGMT